MKPKPLETVIPAKSFLPRRPRKTILVYFFVMIALLGVPETLDTKHGPSGSVWLGIMHDIDLDMR